MVFTLFIRTCYGYKPAKKNPVALDVYYYPIGRTLRPSVEPVSVGTLYPGGGQFALVQNVRGDIVL